MEAFDAILETRPDLVFTDIRMPGIDGLELIKKCSVLVPNTLFIVMSGHAEFSYAQEAMKNGAIGYCLKPFDDQEIDDLLRKAQLLTEKIKASIGYDLIACLENQSNASSNIITGLLESGGLTVKDGRPIVPVVSIGPVKLTFPVSVRFIELKLGLNKYGYLTQQTGETDIASYIADNINKNTLGVGISTAVESIDKIRDTLESASIEAYRFFTTGRTGVFRSVDFKDADISGLLVLFEENIRIRNMSEVDNLINRVTEGFKAGVYNIRHAFVFYNRLMAIIYTGNSQQYEDFVFSYEQLIGLFGNSEDMLSFIKNNILEKINPDQANIVNELKDEYFKEIVKYIDTNFYKDISLQNIAREFNINISYICQLFNRKMHTTFTEYLRKLRISYACNILRETDLSIGEVSTRAGFNDYFYFCRVFKKYTQTTPSIYRSNSDQIQ